MKADFAYLIYYMKGLSLLKRSMAGSQGSHCTFLYIMGYVSSEGAVNKQDN
jgi:hypothetical protein